nr:MAG TPA: Surface-adhesin protein E [Caudoviricetes sp.]
MWNQKMKGILLTLGSLCLLQNVSAETLGGFDVRNTQVGEKGTLFIIDLPKGEYFGIYNPRLKGFTACRAINKQGFVECFNNGIKGAEFSYGVHSFRRIVQANCKKQQIRDIVVSAHSGDFGTGSELVVSVDNTWRIFSKYPADLSELACAIIKNQK